ncbi:hypothetical protein FACS1894172_18740 [Spirochaetia bacterium]|nr:hypothetical protein FACS1894172_18740 [Spirochaetia bacterium]
MIFVILTIPILLLFTYAMLMYPPSVYYKIKIKNELKKDTRIEKLTYFEHFLGFWDDNRFNIGLELKDDKSILVRREEDEYQGIIEIDNYKIHVLEFNFNTDPDNFHSNYIPGNGIYYTEGLKGWVLQIMLNKPEGYFYNLDDYINYYDEIKEIIEKIYSENRIPGEDVIPEDSWFIKDTDKWGDDNEFSNYMGYVIVDENNRVKIYVDKIRD